ncbi:MAG: FG-GAP-like repeat-containing protein, partial [Bacteroidota bacterium]
EVARQVITKEGVNFKKLIDTIPSNPIPNYMFKNQGNVTFENVAKDWGLAIPSHSNGAAYGDLDNDGDLDLVVNNVNAECFVFRNETDQVYPDRNFLKVKLEGKQSNTQALGANVELRVNGKSFYREKIGVRGFQSNVDDRLNFGLGAVNTIDTVLVNWPDNRQTLLTNVASNQTLILKQDEADRDVVSTAKSKVDQTFSEVTNELSWGFVHRENRFVDFDRDRLIYHMVSNEGPKLARGDVNGDGLEDVYIGGAAQSPGAMLIQQTDGTFQRSNERLLEIDRNGEDTDCIFFDADGDNDLDLYVARGGNEFIGSNQVLADQLYFNDGQGNFSRSAQFLPTIKPESSSCVRAADFDNDGDMDLLVGIRIIPGYYGLNANAYLLKNDGKGKFSNVTKELVPELDRVGMVTDVYWLDYDKDEDLDFVVVGEWMPITVFENKGAEFRVDRSAVVGKSNGWWNCIRPGDFDNDGDIDMIVGNHGLNTRFRASEKEPITIYINDFDDNGTPEQLISQYNGGESYPLVLRHDLVMQLPKLKKKYLKYNDYKEQTFEEIFTPEERKGTVTKEVYNLESSILLNQGNGKFEVKALPLEAQYAPAMGLLVEDIDKDGKLDVLVGGNQYRVKPEVGRYDANYGLWLKGNGDGTFQPIKSKDSGLNLRGEVRDFEIVEINGKRHLLVAKNNDQMQVFTY